MARLDRLNTAKELAQLGATIGREFSYEVLHAVSPLDEDNLQQGLRQLVEVELLYQRGLLPQARYIFKHALIQDTAYQSLLKSRRQRLHQQIAQVLEERFPETKETQPELVAHHYTEAGLNEQAIPYWQQAGQRAIQRSANVEAISHLTKGLELLKTFPDTPGRAQQELALQTILGPILLATKGFASPEVKETYDRALHLCSQIGETAQLFPILRGLWQFYFVRAECRTARELGEQLLSLAQQVQDPVLLVPAYRALGTILFSLGEFVAARKHLDQGIALYDLQQHRAFLSSYGADSGVLCLFSAAMVLWPLGYPDQALKRSREALILAQELSHPFSLAIAFLGAGQLHQFRRERQATQEWAETLITFSSEQGFPFPLAVGTILQGLTWAEQGQREEGIAQIHRGLVAHRATGAELGRPYFLAWLAETYGNAEQSAEGLIVLDEALTAAHKNEERHHEAELYRLKGELTLQQFQVQGSKFKVEDRLGSSVQRLESEAEECFLKAIEIAQRQQAKSLELRAVMSLVRLRQRQAILLASRDTDHATRDTQHATLLKLDKARTMLSEIYGWFTEGFDTKDLQEAKMLLDELSEGR
jgi:predicted ATPase